MGFPKIRGTILGPNNKNYSILGSMLGSPNFGELPNHCVAPLAPHGINTKPSWLLPTNGAAPKYLA